MKNSMENIHNDVKVFKGEITNFNSIGNRNG